MNKTTQHYRGRFAPSPTGQLHFGSLIAAVASYLQARQSGGEWLVRIEDIDETRTVPGSADNILSQLDQFGFEWDGEVVYQSQRKALYQAYLDLLINDGLIYACDCTRSSLRQQTEQTNSPHIYPGNCRHNPISIRQPHALRCLTDNRNIAFTDIIQGNIKLQLESDCGDFIVKRRDGFFAYQLVVVIDDAEQKVTEIVRGADLLDATPQQIYLQDLMSLYHPRYAHIPVAMRLSGQKLSKSHEDLAINPKMNITQLCDVLNFLNQSPPDELYHASLSEFWQWAIEHWNIKATPSKAEIIV